MQENPFFDDEDLAPPPLAENQDVKLDTSRPTDDVLAEAASENPFMEEVPVPDNAPREYLDHDEFKRQLIKRIRRHQRGETPTTVTALSEWAESVGRPGLDRKQLEENLDWEGEIKVVPSKEDNPDTISVDELGSFFRGMNIATGFGDELAAGISAVPELLTGGDFEQAYRDKWQQFQDQEAIDKVVTPEARMMGQGLGLALGAAAPVAAVRSGAGLGANTLRSGGIGAIEGVIVGTGDGTPDDRFGQTLTKAAEGGGIGGLLPGAGRVVGKVATPVTDFVASKLSPAKALSRRLGLKDPNRLKERAAEIRSIGAEPTAFDTFGEAGQDVVGALGRRQTPARQEFQQFADARREGLGDRIGEQAKRISDDTRTPDELVEGIKTNRSESIAEAMNPIRQTPVPLTSDVTDVLATPEGRSAINAAMRLEPDLAVRENIQNISRAVKSLQGVDPRMPEAARRQVIDQIMGDTVFDVNAVDKISRAFKDASSVAARKGDAGRARALNEFGTTVRNSAKFGPDGELTDYGRALEQFGADSEAANAVRLGEDILKPNTDEFVEGAGKLSDEPSGFGASPRDLARAGARRAVERKAGEGTSGAFAAGRKFQAPEQQARTAALIGDDGAAELGNAMATEVRMAEDASLRAPRSGSRTQMNELDERGVHSVSNLLASPGPATAIREGIRLLSRAGITDDAAEKIVRMSIDPAQTDAVVELLTKRLNGDRKAASAMVDTIRSTAIRLTEGEQ